MLPYMYGVMHSTKYCATPAPTPCVISVCLSIFNTRFEVGVRVEGYDVGGEPRHINSAFYIFRADQGDLIIPEPVTESKVCT